MTGFDRAQAAYDSDTPAYLDDCGHRKWIVVADGGTVGEFDDQEDAENMASAWNSAYPHDPWFEVVEIETST